MADTSLVFWDWNGTLMDDVRYSVACLNGLLEEYGYEQRYSLGRYREIFGFPIEAYYRRAGFDFDRDPYPVLADSYMQRYNADVDACPLTAGAARALETVAGRGIRQAILSVSRQDYLMQQAGHRGIGGLFQEMLGLKDIYGAGKVDLGRQYLASSGAAASWWETPTTTPRPPGPWGCAASSTPAATRAAPVWPPQAAS